jgi:tetratricopeptide (TPR) repeat protein
LKIVEEYLQRHPDVAEAHGYRGNALMTMNKLDDALAAYERVDALDPTATIGANGRWAVYVVRRQWDDARATGEKLTAGSDSFARYLGHFQIAMLELFRGRARASVAAFERARGAYARPGPNTANARARSASALLALGNGAAALDEALAARREAGNSAAQAPAMQAMALAQLATGRAQEADRTLDELQRLGAALPGDRDRRRAQYVAAQLAAARGDHSTAIGKLLDALKGLPQQLSVPPEGAIGSQAPQIWFALGSAYLAVGQPGNAEPWLRRLADSPTGRLNAPLEHVRSIFLLAQIHESRGELATARDEYRRFLDYWRDGDLDRDKVADAERKVRGAVTQ